MNTPRTPADAGSQRFRAIPTTSLRVGAELESPILDVEGGRSVLLVAERTVITSALIAQLSRRGISKVQIELADFERMAQDPASAVETPQEVRRRRRMSFQATEGANGETFGIREDSFIHQLDDPGAVSYQDAERREFLSNMDSAVDEVGDFFQALEHGGRQHQPGSVAASSLSDAVHDLDLFVSLGVNSAADSYPQKHSVQVSMLAMALGTTMGLNEDELRELGTGCLIHDGGMLMMRDRVWQESHQLSKLEFLEITKHPGLVYDRICQRENLSTGTCMVVYQMHERWNGSGYPRQRSAKQIHPLARIASVADTFVALVCPRPHRQAILPYQAMEKIIHGASQGLFDPDAVRGLLHTVSLFPVTSFVVTSDGRVGRVIRTNGDLYTQPVLDVWDPGDMQKPPEPVDLAEETDLKVLRPLTQFEIEELGLG